MKIKRGPDFLGIGAPRCGTTWLHTKMQSHPDVWVPPHKELHFFDRAAHYTSPSHFSIESPWERLRLWAKPEDDVAPLPAFRRTAGALSRREFDKARWWWRVGVGRYDLQFYSRLFPRSGYAVCGEITPAYSILEDRDIEDIKTVNPDVKLIFMIRNPVEQLWSGLRYRRGRNFTQLDLSDENQVIEALRVQQNSGSGIRRGEYQKTLEAYLRVFPANQILVVFYDAIKNDLGTVLAKLSEFLGIDPAGFEGDVGRINASKSQTEVPEQVRAYLQETESPLINKMAEDFGSYALLWRDGVMPPPAELRAALRYDEVRS